MTFRQARTAPTVSLSTIQRTTVSSISPVVPSAISWSLTKSVLHSQRTLRRRPLTPQLRWNPLQWCPSRSAWLPSDWHHIMLNDKSRFTVEADLPSSLCQKRPGLTEVQAIRRQFKACFVLGGDRDQLNVALEQGWRTNGT
ncbi:transposable element Tcb2 transposase [Trichonephila clavipes]|nr:transposable element Tcb2 transposase [Trichonephila clavipes]